MTNVGRDAYYAAGGDATAGGGVNGPIQIPQAFAFTPQRGDQGLADSTAARTPNPYLPSGYGEPIGTADVQVKQLRPGVWYWRYNRYTANAGFRQMVSLKDPTQPTGHAASASGSMDKRFPRQGILSQLVTKQTSPDPGAGTNGYYMSHVNAFGTLAIALDTDGAQTFLYKETSATDPTLIQITYAKGVTHDITGLASFTLAGVPYVAVEQVGGAIELLSDLVTGGPTSPGSMHFDTTTCHGIVVGPDPTAYIIMKSLGGDTMESIRVLAPSAIRTTQPTPTVTNLPIGGYAVSPRMLAVGGPPLRAYFNCPPNTNASFLLPGSGSGSAASALSSYQGRIYSCNARGFDWEEYGQSQMPLNNVILSSGFRDGLLGSDTDRLIFSNLIRAPKDLRLGRDRFNNSDRRRRIVGWWTKNNYDLYGLEEETLSLGGASAVSAFQIMFYDWDQDEWSPASVQTAYATNNIQSFSPGGTLPLSDTTGFMHMRGESGSGGNWYRQSQPPPATNPYQYRRSTGGTASTGTQFAATGQDVSAEMTFAELPPGAILVPHRAYWGGQADEGSVALSLSGRGDSGSAITAPTITWNAPTNTASRFRDVAPNRMQTIQLTITATQGSDTYKTPQVYPLSLEGIAFADEAAYDRWTQQGAITWG